MTREVNVNLILEFRKATKMTVKEFCERSNIGTTTYYKIINKKNAKIETLNGVAKTMKISVLNLLNEN